jgi:hypothetical protein
VCQSDSLGRIIILIMLCSVALERSREGIASELVQLVAKNEELSVKAARADEIAQQAKEVGQFVT